MGGKRDKEVGIENRVQETGGKRSSRQGNRKVSALQGFY